MRRIGIGVALACAAIATSVPHVAADDQIHDQPYETAVGLDAIHDQGLSGKGVTIAIIDGPVDFTVPELKGVDIESWSICDGFEYNDLDAAHATAVTSIIASPEYGWAPGATIHHYAAPSEWEVGDRPIPPGCENGVSRAVHRAIAEGADIISTSLGTYPEESALAFLHAVEEDIPVVLATGNDGTDDTDDARTNGTIGVGASDLDGNPEPWSTWGEGLVVLAPAVDLAQRVSPTPGADVGKGSQTYGWDLEDVIGDVAATSFAAPQVAGLLALGKEAHPEATGNQLIQALIATAGTGGDEWDPKTGYGAIAPQAFIDADPLAYDDKNPLMDKSPSLPGAEELQDLRDGLIAPEELPGYDDYVYRGDSADVAKQDPRHSAMCTSPRYEREGLPASCTTVAARLARVPKGAWIAIGAGATIAALGVVAVVRVRRGGRSGGAHSRA